MIDGPWGSGKSYFVESVFKTRLSEIKSHIAFWYASLAGATDANAVYENFFVSAQGRAGRLGWNSLPERSHSSRERLSVPKKTLQKYGVRRLIFSKILVLDDLERSSMPVLESLSPVNSFARDGSRVIVIAHEAEIENGKGNAADAARAAWDSAERSTARILDVFRASEKQYLCSLRQRNEDFDQLLNGLDDDPIAHPSATDDILVHLLAVETEFRAGSPGKVSESVDALPKKACRAKRRAIRRSSKSGRERSYSVPFVRRKPLSSLLRKEKRTRTTTSITRASRTLAPLLDAPVHRGRRPSCRVRR